jgi:hypothetical protein
MWCLIGGSSRYCDPRCGLRDPCLLGAVGGVVEEGDDFDVVVLGEEAGVVPEAEGGVGGEGKGAALAVQTPDDAAVGAVDFEEGAGVARGDEVVAGGVLCDAVDVEVVPGVGGVVARAGLAGVEGEDGFVWGDVVEAGPFEEEFSGGDVEFLKDCVDNPLLLGASTPSAQIPRHRLVDFNQACLLVDNGKLVLVNQLVVARTKLADGLVMLIKERDVTMAVSVASVVVAFEAVEHVFALPTAGLKVGSPDAVDAVARPHEVAVIAEDVWPRLMKTMLLSGGVGIPSKKVVEEIPLSAFLVARMVMLIRGGARCERNC